MTTYLTADEAARRLGVSRQTLYAYVSRGLVVAKPGEDPRQSLYIAEEIDRLAGDRRRGRRPKEIAKSTIDWGVPLLESAITLIEGGRLYYRGRDALALAEAASLEQLAAHLWQLPDEASFGPDVARPDPAYEAILPGLTAQPANQSLLTLFAAASRDDETAHWRSGAEQIASGCGDLVRLMTAAALRRMPSADPIHLQFAQAFGCDADAADLLRRALILCGDHELNASGFTARCVASTGASIRAAVIGGLAALSGYKHGSATVRIEQWLTGIGSGDAERALRQRLDAGDDLPGFGHPLYPAGDIRAIALLEQVGRIDPRANALADDVIRLTGKRPTIDFALVALTRALGLPDGTAFLLFAVGRSVGWIAHALEQRAAGTLIRPRAVYTGERPGEPAL
jgi:citrate synthase